MDNLTFNEIVIIAVGCMVTLIVTFLWVRHQTKIRKKKREYYFSRLKDRR